jgi:hypothetical protein
MVSIAQREFGHQYVASPHRRLSLYPHSKFSLQPTLSLQPPTQLFGTSVPLSVIRYPGDFETYPAHATGRIGY